MARHPSDRFGLVKIDLDKLRIERRAADQKFSYFHTCTSAAPTKERLVEIDNLVIPPKWQKVQIACHNSYHIQATGRDAAGVLQYLYHPDWEHVRNYEKLKRMIVFGKALPKIRRQYRRDLKSPKSHRRLSLAASVGLLDLNKARPGHETYRKNGTVGISNLKPFHVQTTQKQSRIAYRGKAAQKIKFDVRDAQVHRALTMLKKRAAHKKAPLFTRVQKGSKKTKLKAVEINDYLKSASDLPVSAKDFRTFAASAKALELLCQRLPENEKDCRKAVTQTMKAVSEMLRNTPAVARSSYVHPTIVTAFENGELSPALLSGRPRQGLSSAETALMRFLEKF